MFTVSLLFLKNVHVYLQSLLKFKVDLLKFVLSTAVNCFKNIYCLYPHRLKKKYNSQLYYVDLSKYTTQDRLKRMTLILLKTYFIVRTESKCMICFIVIAVQCLKYLKSICIRFVWRHNQKFALTLCNLQLIYILKSHNKKFQFSLSAILDFQIWLFLLFIYYENRTQSTSNYCSSTTVKKYQIQIPCGKKKPENVYLFATLRLFID